MNGRYEIMLLETLFEEQENNEEENKESVLENENSKESVISIFNYLNTSDIF
jgi:hypothetical protein